MVKWWNFVCSKIRVLTFAINNFQKHDVSISSVTDVNDVISICRFEKRFNCISQEWMSESWWNFTKMIDSIWWYRLQSLEIISSFLTEIRRHHYLTLRPSCNDVTTPFFLSVISENFKKYYLLIKGLSCKKFIEIEVKVSNTTWSVPEYRRDK